MSEEKTEIGKDEKCHNQGRDFKIVGFRDEEYTVQRQRLTSRAIALISLCGSHTEKFDASTVEKEEMKKPKVAIERTNRLRPK